MKSTQFPLPESASLLARAGTVLSDLSGLDEIGDPALLKAEIERRLRLEMTAVIDASNRFVEKHGLPLERYRAF